MGWRTVVVNSHCKLSYQNNHLVYKSLEKTEMIHLSEIDILILETTDIVISTMLIKRLVDEKTLVIFCDDKRLPTAYLNPYYGKHDSSLQISKQINWKQEIKEIIWTNIICQKIINQSNFIDELGFKEKYQSLIDLYNNIERYDPTNREGHAARIYFNTLFGNNFTREEETDINAGLNYGYTILMSMFAREIVACGCITQLGLKHANQFNQYNLACDLMEPFRPIIDRIIYSNRYTMFTDMKKSLLNIFNERYLYNGKEMYLINIVSEYTKATIKSLNKNMEEIPQFIL